MNAEIEQENLVTQSTTSLNPADLLKNEIDQVNQFYNLAIDFFSNYSFQLIGALIIFILGYIVAGKISNLVLRLCQRHKLDTTLSQFLSNTTKMIIVLMISIVSLGKLGISVTPFIAAIGAISLGAGLALQGLLANYAAGFNIILIRPFVVGDTITVQGRTGIVTEVLLAYTILHDEDNVKITIPNKHIVGEVLSNSNEDSLLELTVGIAYKEDPMKTIALLENAISDAHIKITIGCNDEYGFVQILDNAKGIPQDILAHIFDSYFTTKDEDKGTGIGLYMSKLIIEENMSGKIEAKNIKDGAQFLIQIPLFRRKSL